MTDAPVTGPPDFVIKFDGELTPEQLDHLRSMWEAAMRPEQSLVVRGIIAQAVREAVAAERERIRAGVERVRETCYTPFSRALLDEFAHLLDGGGDDR